MSTMQDVIDQARIPLNDLAGTRYSNTDLLRYANAGVRRAFQVRPDLRLGNYSTPYTDLAVGGAFPLPDEYLQAIADYVVFRAETKDDEHVISERVTVFMNSFTQGLLS